MPGPLQQTVLPIVGLCAAGLPKVLQQQLATAGHFVSSFHTGSPVSSGEQQQHKQRRQLPGTSRISSSYPRPRGFPGYRSRLPQARKYGAELRDRDPQAFEQMRLIVGYYDLPENRNKPRPSPPTHVTINNLQTLRFTKDVDSYYKLALLSYRSKLANLDVLKVLDKSQVFLQKISAPPEFVPNVEGLAAAPKQQQLQQQQQQQEGQQHS